MKGPVIVIDFIYKIYTKIYIYMHTNASINIQWEIGSIKAFFKKII